MMNISLEIRNCRAGLVAEATEILCSGKNLNIVDALKEYK